MPLFTLQAPCSTDPAVHAELALEQFSTLDRARDVALELVKEFGTDIAIVQHFGAACCVCEEYPASVYA
jgi:hypothetical protein